MEPSELDFEDAFVVVIGSFEGFVREEAEDIVEDCGGTVQKSVNGKTTLLIVGEKPGKSKVDKAESLGVKTMSGERFIGLAEG